jgi:type I restriction enzyme S subunit
MLEVSFIPMEKLGENGILELDLAKPLGEVRQGFTYFRDNDVIFAKITPSFENGKVAVCRNLENGIGFGTTELHVLRTRSHLCEPRYIFYVVSSSEFRQLGIASMQGVAGQQRVTEKFVAEFLVLLPPLHEQRAIADFLDRETAHIDALIARKQRLLDLLAERRQALITHAVTKGLDPDAPMKDSGVEWLGEIPEGWGLASLKHVAEVRTGIAKGRVLNSDNAIPVPYLRVANVQDGYLDLSDVAEIEVLPHELPQYSLQIGDVLMNEGGDSDKLGRGAVWDGSIEPCIHQNHVFAVRCFDVDPEWLSAITSSDYAKAYFESRAKQTTNLASISATNLRELPVVTPRRDEQTAIVTFLEQQTSKIDTLCDRIRRVVASLQERRAALINEAVTGKIRVTE